MSLLGVTLLLGGCGNVVSGTMAAMRADSERSEEESKKKPELTQLQIREMQTREYETDDTKQIQRVALAVLQDDGFVVANANTELGLLSASKNLHEKQVDDASTAFFKGFLGFWSISTEEWSNIETTLTVNPFGSRTRVRLSARLTAAGSDGSSNYEAITEPEFYQDFFTKLEKGLFIEREQI
ncbi:MAG: hypothetical protein KDE35_11635 [Geminicoccaceae bacterium]|nr:hypothetical protein [Geminicoccaceae bacterium]